MAARGERGAAGPARDLARLCCCRTRFAPRFFNDAVETPGIDGCHADGGWCGCAPWAFGAACSGPIWRGVGDWFHALSCLDLVARGYVITLVDLCHSYLYA